MSFDTPIIGKCSKKRELSSPEDSVDPKKNKAVPEPLVPPPLSMASKDSQTIVIPPTEMEKLSKLLVETFKGEIETLVQNIVSGVLNGLIQKIEGLETNIKSLQNKNEELVKQNTSLLSRISSLEKIADQSEKYSWRSSLRISGFKENTGESTDNIIMNMAATIGCDLQIEEIDRSHRVGKPDVNKSRQREILVKFYSYRARQKLYTMETKLKDYGYDGVFLNEDLTKTRSKILYEARKVVKSDRAKGAWSADGNILIKDFADKVNRLSSVDDLTGIVFPLKPPPAPPAPAAEPVEAAVFMD